VNLSNQSLSYYNIAENINHFKSPPVVKIKLLMLFICLCGVINMLYDKSCSNSLVDSIAEYFLLKTAVNQRQSQTHVFLTSHTTL